MTRVTELLDGAQSTESSILRARDLLLAGELVAFPTETVYGLGSLVFNEAQIQKIFHVKQRPSDNPLIVHVSDEAQISQIVEEFSSLGQRLVAQFFPGSLTLVLPKNKAVPAIVSAGLSSVAFRMPAHDVALELIRAVGQPLVAPSANISGRPSPTTAQHVIDDLSGKIAAVLDGGPCRVGIESTVLSIVNDLPVILRPGAITKEMLEEFLGQRVQVLEGTTQSQSASPGVKYRHYSPSIPVTFVQSYDSIPSEPTLRILVSDTNNIDSRTRQLSSAALYAEFRNAEHDGSTGIYIVLSDDILSDTALMNRLSKVGI